MNIQGMLPAITAPLQAQNANAKAATSAASGIPTNGSNSLSSTSLEETFLNLLATEMQNQDPTSPIDPTAMVGQLVSMNQLDQLISINQILSSLTGLAPSDSSTKQSSSTSAPSVLGAVGGVGSASPASSSTSLPATNPYQPANIGATGANSLMNLYGNFAVPAQTSTLSPIGGR